MLFLPFLLFQFFLELFRGRTPAGNVPPRAPSANRSGRPPFASDPLARASSDFLPSFVHRLPCQMASLVRHHLRLRLRSYIAAPANWLRSYIPHAQNPGFVRTASRRRTPGTPSSSSARLLPPVTRTNTPLPLGFARTPLLRSQTENGFARTTPPSPAASCAHRLSRHMASVVPPPRALTPASLVPPLVPRTPGTPSSTSAPLPPPNTRTNSTLSARVRSYIASPAKWLRSYRPPAPYPWLRSYRRATGASRLLHSRPFGSAPPDSLCDFPIPCARKRAGEFPSSDERPGGGPDRRTGRCTDRRAFACGRSGVNHHGPQQHERHRRRSIR